MSTSALSRGGGNSYVARSNSSGLYDVLDLLLDKGLVIDVFLRVSLVGIELLTVDARIVIASVDTYLRFAEAVNRLDLGNAQGEGLPDLMNDITEGGASSKTKGVLEGAKEKIFGSDDDDSSDKDSDSDDSESSSGGSGSSRRSASRSGSGSGSRSRARASRGRSSSSS
ncbi:MAG: gas vesicle structural protein [Solirubrobacteraceae bacterium]|nr:gas vesicle structural protein [Solirubrobacteraceae bacterium]